ncbi:transglutaminase-like domain-containing protein [Actinopolyspora mortivallis]|uniref:transglutaminase-like domain-containing protein n=1 Tax=Actinopolyspora mortivallis TaxID=33906 RepID=UPI00037CA694|nr:transglutaminase-like domain-containing protein [Actinopolyspora mortivallis]
MEPTEFLDHDSGPVRDFVHCAVEGAESSREKAVRLYYAVRDGVDYEVYGSDMSRHGLRASTIVENGRGFCVHKSVLYAAAVRAVGIPSRIVVTKVRNHLASDRLRSLVGGDTFVHWLTSVRIDGRWLRATPVFNRLLCRLYGMSPLEFDGTSESLYHPFDSRGGERMEFLASYGEYDDVDYEGLMALMRREHPAMFGSEVRIAGEGSLLDEAPVQRA